MWRGDERTTHQEGTRGHIPISHGVGMPTMVRHEGAKED
jgi:hypothetical protein